MTTEPRMSMDYKDCTGYTDSQEKFVASINA